MLDFTGKIVLITGGTSGIGLATARLFRKEGAHVYLTGRDPRGIDDARAELGDGATVLRADSADLDDLDRLVNEVRSAHGRLDVLYANAGVQQAQQTISDITPEAYDRVFATNARGTFFTVQKALELMPDGASIVLTGGTTRFKGTPGLSAYAASKAVLRSFVRSWASDLAPRRIRVNLVDPGSIETPPLAALPDEVRAFMVGLTPAGRLGTPEEIAAAVAFLASDRASFVNGVALAVDGAMHQI